MERAGEIFRRAAATGFARAQVKFANMLERGLGGLTKDLNAAMQLYALAASQVPPACAHPYMLLLLLLP